MSMIPEGFRPLLDVVNEHGADVLGPKLAAGKIPLSYFNDRHRVAVVRPGNLFRGERGETVLRTGCLVSEHGTIGAQLLVNEESLRQSLRPKLSVVVDNVKPLRAKGGRPTTHDWAGAAARAAYYIGENDYPEKKADLVRDLLEWFGDNAPDKREIERFVDTIYKQRGN